MALFSDAQLSELRGFFAGLACKDDCLVERPVGTQDVLGSPDAGLVTIGTFKADVVLPTESMLATYASQIGSQLTWQVEFPWGSNVRKNDTLTVNGKKMTVQAVSDPDTYGVFHSVLASQVN